MRDPAMTHQEAEKSGSAARYLLGEMSADEREAFEEHLFACPDCARIVQADLILKTCRQALRGEGAHSEQDKERIGSPIIGRIFDRLAVGPKISAAAIFAAACFAPLAAYQYFFELPILQEENKRLTAPRALDYHQLETSVRSAERIVRLREDCIEVALWFEFAPELESEKGFPDYRCIIESEAGRRFAIPHPAPDDFTLRLLIPCSALPAGKYTLSVYGIRNQGQVLIDEFDFETQLE